MSFIDKIMKKIREKEMILNKKYGIQVCEIPKLDQNKMIYFILSNAMINFLIVIGMLGCVLKPFDIRCDYTLLLCFGLIISVCLAFLYYKLYIKIIGYLIIITGFIWSVFQYRYVLRGGFAYIINTYMEFFEKDLDLPIEKRYNVYGTSERFAMTLCIIFIAFTIMLLFNMVITEAKGYVLIFLLTFPFAQIPLYFELKIPKFYLAMYVAGLLALYLLRNTKHYKMEYKKKKGYFVKIHTKSETTVYDYVNDGKNTFWTILIIAVATIVILFATYSIYPEKKFKMDDKYREYRENTRDFTKELILQGFSGMLKKNTGWVGRSRLGQAKYIKLDYQTDLIVQKEYVEDERTLYLKSFIGSFYDNAYWKTIREYQGKKVDLKDYGIKNSDIIYDSCFNIWDHMEVSNRIKIVNIDANSNFDYEPYYKRKYIDDSISSRIDDLNDDEFANPLKKNWYSTLKYYPLINNISTSEFSEAANNNRKEIDNDDNDEYKESFIKLDQYSKYVHDMYLDVPEKNTKTIQQFCKKYNLTKDTPDLPEKLAAIFQQDYEYTLMPGRTPHNEEFVNYFLTKQKKGYCTYFATASTLIFRYLGIPARYVTGYAINTSDLASGTQLRENQIREPFQNYENVYEYDVNDSQAHAWTEIYIENFGWLPVETTPSSDEEQPKPEDTNSFGGFMQNNILTQKNLDVVKKTSASLFIIVIVCVVITIIGYIGFGIFYRRKRRNNPSVIFQLDYLFRCFEINGILRNKYESYEENAQMIIENGIVEESVMMQLIEIVNKEKFSGKEISIKDHDFVKEKVEEISQRFYNNLKWYKKLYFKYIRLL